VENRFNVTLKFVSVARYIRLRY